MAEQKDNTVRPFTTFNFKVVFTREGQSEPICNAAFSECDGLEMTMEPKTYQEGGNNFAQHHLVGPVTYGQLTLKRGMTDSYDLWRWFDDVVGGQLGHRVNGEVLFLGSQPKNKDGSDNIRMSFYLSRCLPIKLRAPTLNATDSSVAIEEMQVAYERLKVVYPS